MGQHKHMYALRIRLHDRQPSECMRSGFSASADAQEKARTCQIVSVLGAGVRVRHKGYHAEVRRKRRWCGGRLRKGRGLLSAFVHKSGGYYSADIALRSSSDG
jgi:hypothetical protein